MRKAAQIKNIENMNEATLRRLAYLALQIVGVNDDGQIHIKRSRDAQEAAQRIAYMAHAPKSISLDGYYHEERV